MENVIVEFGNAAISVHGCIMLTRPSDRRTDALTHACMHGWTEAIFLPMSHLSNYSTMRDNNKGGLEGRKYSSKGSSLQGAANQFEMWSEESLFLLVHVVLYRVGGLNIYLFVCFHKISGKKHPIS